MVPDSLHLLDEDDQNWPLLARYYAGRATPDEIEGVRRWIGGDLSRQREVDVLRQVWAQSGKITPPQERGDVERVWSALDRRLRGSGEAFEDGKFVSVAGQRRHRGASMPPRLMAAATSPSRMLWLSVRRVGVAAAAIATLMVGISLSHSTAQHRVGTPTTYITKNGQRAEVRLSDGTQVTLNVGSRIDVPADFDDGDHTVHLTGEADFRVTHRSGAPFIVEAAGKSTRVLGTEFGVQAYHSDNVQVAVREGRVAFGTTVLQAGDVARVGIDGQVHMARGESADDALDFVTGKLVIAHMPLRSAIPFLDRWYDVDIQLGDTTLGDVPMHAVLSGGSSGDLLEILHVTFDARVVKQGRTLTLFREKP